MDIEHNVNIDQKSLNAQLVVRIAVGKLRRLDYSEREILELIQNAVTAYKPSLVEVACSRPIRKEGGNIYE